MALIRPLVGLVLVSALVPGCSQSLFANPDDDGNGGRDGGNGGGDGGSVDPTDGGGEARPDASVPTSCPEPCLYDAVAEFDYLGSGGSGVWLYAEDLRDLLGTSYSDMQVQTRADGTRAYVGSSLNLPAIVHCPSHPSYPNCAGVEDKILFETGALGDNYPALVWSAPQGTRRRYRLSSDWRIPSGAPVDAPMTLRLVRNSQFDTVVEAQFSTSKDPGAFDIELDVQPGDGLRLIAIPGDSSSVPLALSFYVSEAQTPETCRMTTFFEGVGGGGSAQFAELCASSMFTDQAETGEACPAPNPTCPPTTRDLMATHVRGQARAFVEGAAVLFNGPPNPYMGDWTVQFWAYLASEGSWTIETVLADHDCEAEGGIRMTRYSFGADSEVNFDAYYADPEFDQCTNGPARLTTSVGNDRWHFFRLTRSTATGTMSVCVDGVHQGDKPVPGDADMSAPASMWLGRAVTYEPAYFRGSLADLRVFGEALPCSAR
jgi:hypothetical protein